MKRTHLKSRLNIETFQYKINKENILNIKKKNIISRVGFESKRKNFNQMNTIIKIKDFLKNQIYIYI